VPVARQRIHGQEKCASLKTLVHYQPAAAIPQEKLHPVAPTVQEHEHVAAHWVGPHQAPGGRRKTIKAPPQVHRLRSKKYMKVALLVIDEVGFQPLDRLEASLFFRLVSYRYQRGSILVTTNKAVKDWPEVLARDEVMTTALLDRLLHRCHVLNIKGRSYRLRDIERLMR
jgi:hypothetical protein